MTRYFSYHPNVRRVGVSALFLLLMLVPALRAQIIHSIPPSVTSLAPDRPNINVPPGVTSFGVNPLIPRKPSSPEFHHHHHRRLGATPYYAVPLYVPYYAEDYVDPSTADDSADQYRGGPTIFDRRGPGPPARASTDYVEHSVVRTPAPSTPDETSSASATPVSDEPATVLVFKDGHQVEVKNYLILGDQLFDLGSGRSRKVALADLDLPATQKLNDDRGIDFQMPSRPAGD